LVNLDPTVGSEIKKSRPCVVVSPPVTHRGQRGLILLDQVRAVDKVRLVKKLGAVSAKTLAATLDTLQEVFAAE
jgi:mRNA interferase MazF